MPGTDMNLEWLKNYKGMGAAPEDFMDFWKRQLEVIQEEKPAMTLEPAEIRIPGARCYWAKLAWKGEGSTTLYAKLMIPDPVDGEAEARYPASLVFHDYPEASKSWFHLARYLALGMIVLAPDCRDQAGRSHGGFMGRGTGSYGPMFLGLEDEVTNMYLYQIYGDAIRWLHALKELPEVDSGNLHTYGSGQGAGLALACAFAMADIRSCGLQYPMLCDYRRVWEKDFIQSGYMGLHYYFRWHDPLHEHGEEIFHKLSYLDIQHMAPYVRANCIVSTGLGDLISPPSAQFAVVNRMTCQVRHLVYPKHGHELNNFFENEYLKYLMERMK